MYTNYLFIFSITTLPTTFAQCVRLFLNFETGEKIWEKSYDGTTDCGGIITVRSELGEPIHKVATRGMRLWREFDRRFFAIPRNDRPAVIFAAKDEIIQRVNADFQKLYFGIQTSSDGATTVPCEVNEMTYYGVLARMGALMFVDSETR